jgi:hypothetical protein
MTPVLRKRPRPWVFTLFWAACESVRPSLLLLVYESGDTAPDRGVGAMLYVKSVRMAKRVLLR